MPFDYLNLPTEATRNSLIVLLNYPQLLQQAISQVLEAPWDKLTLTSAFTPPDNYHSCSFLGRLGGIDVAMVLTLQEDHRKAAENHSPRHGSNKIPGVVPEDLQPIMQRYLDRGYRVTYSSGSAGDNSKIPNLTDGQIRFLLGQPGRNSGCDPEGLRVDFSWGVWLCGHKTTDWIHPTYLKLGKPQSKQA